MIPRPTVTDSSGEARSGNGMNHWSREGNEACFLCPQIDRSIPRLARTIADLKDG